MSWASLAAGLFAPLISGYLPSRSPPFLRHYTRREEGTRPSDSHARRFFTSCKALPTSSCVNSLTSQIDISAMQ